MNTRNRHNYISIPAAYCKTGAKRYDGNPFIEALPKLENSKDEILDRIVNYPPEPTSADRKKSELVRIAELGTVNEIVYGFSEYKRAATNMTINVREAYVSRNPLLKEDMQRRTALAIKDNTQAPFPSDWISTAKGMSLLGVSGSGKTTLVKAFSLPYQVVIEHSNYHGQPLQCRQIPWVNIRMSHDATLKSLCLQFFRVVDGILGNTDYLRKARGLGGISEMVDEMVNVATIASIGHVFVDELQNLKAAKGSHAIFVLNLFTEIIERAGMSLTIAGTPALEDVIDENVRNLRKLNSGGESAFGSMKLDDEEFNSYCDTYWNYQLVKNKKPLTKEIRAAWHRAGAGNPAFTSLAFVLANRNEIGGREVLDVAAFERASNVDMAILQPAIIALRSGSSRLLRNFDDLLFKSGSSSLKRLVAWSDGEDYKGANQKEDSEFEEVENIASSTSAKKTGGRNVSKSRKVGAKMNSFALPTENPLLR